MINDNPPWDNPWILSCWPSVPLVLTKPEILGYCFFKFGFLNSKVWILRDLFVSVSLSWNSLHFPHGVVCFHCTLLWQRRFSPKHLAFASFFVNHEVVSYELLLWYRGPSSQFSILFSMWGCIYLFDVTKLVLILRLWTCRRESIYSPSIYTVNARFQSYEQQHTSLSYM